MGGVGDVVFEWCWSVEMSTVCRRFTNIDKTFTPLPASTKIMVFILLFIFMTPFSDIVLFFVMFGRGDNVVSVVEMKTEYDIWFRTFV